MHRLSVLIQIESLFEETNDNTIHDGTEDGADEIMVMLLILVIARLFFTEFGHNAPFSPPVIAVSTRAKDVIVQSLGLITSP